MGRVRRKKGGSSETPRKIYMYMYIFKLCLFQFFQIKKYGRVHASAPSFSLSLDPTMMLCAITENVHYILLQFLQLY